MSGMAIGKAFIHSRTARVENVISSNNEALELDKLTQALAEMDKALSDTLADAQISDENAEIFETYRMFTKDKGWIQKIKHTIFTEKNCRTKIFNGVHILKKQG